MEPNFPISHELNLTQETNEFNRLPDQIGELPGNQRENIGLGESNEHLINNNDNFFVGNNLQKKTIDDGITMIIEYVMQEKICPNIMPYQEKLMAYLKEKIESQVRYK